MNHDDDNTDELVNKVGAQVNAELCERVTKLEQDVQVLLISVTLVSFTLFFLLRELYAMPEVKR